MKTFSRLLAILFLSAISFAPALAETDTFEPVVPKVQSITLEAHEGMKVSWTTEDEAVMGYKVVWSLSQSPTYPGSKSIFVDAHHAKIAYLKAYDGEGDYSVRVCEFLEDRCGMYSNEVIVSGKKQQDKDEDHSKKEDSSSQIDEAPLPPTVTSLTISDEGEGTIAWVMEGDATQGVKVLVSRDVAPVYPTRKGDQAYYVDAKGKERYQIKPYDGAGRYYVRVCVYDGEGCEVFSNEVMLAFASKAEVAGFKDVQKDHSHYDAVSYLREKAVVKGFEDSSFRPEQPINRAEFLKIVMEASAYTPGGSDCFADVAEEWFAEYVCAASKEGFVNGFSDGTFRPTQPIIFAEATKIVANVLALQTDLSYDDSWYEKYVVALQIMNAIPISVDTFTKEITRGEMAEMIYRIDAKKMDKPSKQYQDLVVESVSISLEDAGNGKVAWEVDGLLNKGVKIVWSRNAGPEYPARKGDQTQYVEDQSVTSKQLYAFDGAGTYHVRVCQYLGDRCGSYSNEITVELSEKAEKVFGTSGVQSLQLNVGEENKVSWKVDGFAKQGFKVVYSKAFGPEYPPREGDRADYVGESTARSHSLKAFDGEGTYSVRVCEYLGESCGTYSNQVNIVLEQRDTDHTKDHKDDHQKDKHSGLSDGAAVLSIQLEALEKNKIQWSVEGVSNMGYKVLVSRSPAPEYPARKGDQAIYIEDGKQQSHIVDPFDGAGTYYVQVCEYIGDACGMFSNEITVELVK